MSQLTERYTQHLVRSINDAFAENRSIFSVAVKAELVDAPAGGGLRMGGGQCLRLTIGSVSLTVDEYGDEVK